jgi:hypothetical protein
MVSKILMVGISLKAQSDINGLLEGYLRHFSASKPTRRTGEASSPRVSNFTIVTTLFTKLLKYSITIFSNSKNSLFILDNPNYPIN